MMINVQLPHAMKRISSLSLNKVLVDRLEPMFWVGERNGHRGSIEGILMEFIPDNLLLISGGRIWKMDRGSIHCNLRNFPSLQSGILFGNVLLEIRLNLPFLCSYFFDKTF